MYYYVEKYMIKYSENISKLLVEFKSIAHNKIEKTILISKFGF